MQEVESECAQLLEEQKAQQKHQAQSYATNLQALSTPSGSALGCAACPLSNAALPISTRITALPSATGAASGAGV